MSTSESYYDITLEAHVHVKFVVGVFAQSEDEAIEEARDQAESSGLSGFEYVREAMADEWEVTKVEGGPQ